MSNTNEEKKDIGALWARTSKAGATFLSGKITVDGQEVEIIAFKNTYKKPGDKTPDWRVYPSTPLGQGAGASKPAAKTEARPAKAAAAAVAQDDDIPF